MKKPDPKLLRQLLQYSAIGLEMGFAVAIGGVMGYVMDRWLGTQPWLTLVFLILGIVAAFRSLFNLAKRIERNKNPGPS
jgi:ATP synthase protein I